jgi:ribosomal-protein-alanine N-acetyltransferase
VAAAATLIELLRAESASDARRHWAITADDEVIGLIGLHTWEHHHRRAELGYDMAVSRWGQGIAGEAARAVIDYGFTTMRLHRIEAHTIADNHRSVRLLERLGFQREGTLREYSWEDDLAFHDSAVYGLLSTDR